MKDKINLREEISKAVKDNVAGGIADNKSISDIANKHKAPLELIELMLQMGTAVEMEHTDDPKIAKEIAMDHLMEDPVYYKKLKKMESE